jgi:hypothetical protein
LFEKMLKNFDDGRSKSFYCIAATLLSISDLETSLKKAVHILNTEVTNSDDTKTKSKILKEFLNEAADRNKVGFKLRKRE